VQAAREQWDQLRANVLHIPKKVERKEPRRVTMANGKPGIQTSRGTMPARDIPAAAADDDEEEQEDEKQEEGQQEEGQQEEEQQEGDQQEEEEMEEQEGVEQTP
jgi:hypothetical protein